MLPMKQASVTIDSSGRYVVAVVAVMHRGCHSDIASLAVWFWRSFSHRSSRRRECSF